MTLSRRLEWISFSQRGYDPHQVHDLVLRIEQTLSGVDSHAVTATEVGHATFPLVPNGYDVSSVDELLEDAITRLRARTDPARPIAGPSESKALDRHARVNLLRRCWELRGHRFKRVRFSRGYRITDVDDFTDLVAATSNDTLTSVHAREVLFSEQWRGYDEAAVDAWLDALQQLLRSEGRLPKAADAPKSPDFHLKSVRFKVEVR